MSKYDYLKESYTVGQLIEALQKCDPEMRVVFVDEHTGTCAINAGPSDYICPDMVWSVAIGYVSKDS